jgi:uncharacterized membrane protein YfcA
MYEYIIEIILGISIGTFFGITGIYGTSLILITLDYLNIGDYISNLGSLALIHLLPLSISSFFNFYKANKVNYSLGFILGISIIIGSYFGSKLVVKKQFSIKTIKYMTSSLGFITFVLFFISAQNENN